MKYFPEEFGFAFSICPYEVDGNILYQWTPLQKICEKFGREEVINKFINGTKEYYSASASAGISNNTHYLETSLLISAITDETIHIDCLSIFFRDDPQAALLMLQQRFVQVLSADTAMAGIPAATVTTVNDPVEQVAAVVAIIVPVAVLA